MKKLLVILLLLFPVHGAWGETMLLSCRFYEMIFYLDNKSYPENFIRNYTIDTVKEKTGNEWPLTVNSAKYFKWMSITKEPGKKDSYYARKYEISRFSGEIIMFVSPYTTLTESKEQISDGNLSKITSEFHGKCEKKSNEKKF